MAYGGPDELVLQSIRELAQTLDIHRIEAVSHGVGLGKLRSAERRPQNPAFTPMAMPAPTEAAMTAAIPGDNRVSAGRRHGRTPKGPRSSPPLSWVWVHVTDISIVVLTLLLGLFFVNAFVLSPSHLSLKSLDKVIVFRLYRDLGAANLIAITYGVFTAYWLFFRLCAGMTLGETLFRPRNLPKNSLQKKNSKPLASA